MSEIDFSQLKDLFGTTDKDGNFKLSQGSKDAGRAILAGLAGRREAKRTRKELEAGIKAKQKAFGTQLEEGKKSFEQQLKMLRDMPDMTQASRDLIQAKQEAAEEILRRGDVRDQETRADIVSAVKSGDPRATSALADVLDKTGASQDAARLRALEMKADAGAIGANLAEQNKQFKTALEKQLMDRAGMSADEANRALLELQTAQEAVGARAQAAGDQTAIGLGTLLKDFDFGNPGTQTDTDTDKKYGGKLEDGGYMGEEGFKTKGEFDHKTNKKAVIDEENGEKEAELTGGEVVFNPDQTNKMEEIIAKGDGNKLLKFMRNLLSKPQFQD
tara:strand:+ start:164 stop:1156 length:993 start_codon:yes stop_codon:yes gene_type:complete